MTTAPALTPNEQAGIAALIMAACVSVGIVAARLLTPPPNDDDDDDAEN